MFVLLKNICPYYVLYLKNHAIDKIQVMNCLSQDVKFFIMCPWPWKYNVKSTWLYGTALSKTIINVSIKTKFGILESLCWSMGVGLCTHNFQFVEWTSFILSEFGRLYIDINLSIIWALIWPYLILYLCGANYSTFHVWLKLKFTFAI